MIRQEPARAEANEGGTSYLYHAMGGKDEEKFEGRVATSRRPAGAVSTSTPRPRPALG